MVWRFLSFAVCLLVAGLCGWYLVRDYEPGLGALGAVAGGALCWFLVDLVRGLRVLQWLRLGDAAPVPPAAGLWGEVAQRARRLLRERDRKILEGQQRLQDFLAALQASPNGVVLLDAQGRIEWFNQMAAAHFGFDAQRDLLQHFGNLVRDPGFAGYWAERDFSHDVTMPGRESTPARPVRLSVHLHPYGEGRSLLLSRDITAVEQADAMRRDFVANVSHEIRTPLTVLSGFVETLQSLPLGPAQQQQYLALMAQQAERMQTLVSDLLTLSRLEGSPPPGSSDWVPVQALMLALQQEGEALLMLLDQPGSEALTFDGGTGCEIAGSRSELQSAMANLVSNAVRYTPAGGAIHVAFAVLPDGRARFSVLDTGSGIAPEHIPRLTERFYRVDRSRSRDTGGTGLGLAIVKHVAQRHGAELRIESTPGQGSRFSILFPASRIRPVAISTAVSESFDTA